MLQRKKGL